MGQQHNTTKTPRIHDTGRGIHKRTTVLLLKCESSVSNRGSLLKAIASPTATTSSVVQSRLVCSSFCSLDNRLSRLPVCMQASSSVVRSSTALSVRAVIFRLLRCHPVQSSINGWSRNREHFSKIADRVLPGSMHPLQLFLLFGRKLGLLTA